VRLLKILLIPMIISIPSVWAQDIQRSSHPQGMQVQGNAELKVHQDSSTAVAAGEANAARNTAGAIKGSTQIQGNTRVKAEQKNATATAVGKKNAAGNEVGVIGGK